MSLSLGDGMELQADISERLLTPASGEEIFTLAARIFPICRSITGNGVRQTLQEIRSHLALEVREIPTGTEVFDWTIPHEWNIRERMQNAQSSAYYEDLPRGCRAEHVLTAGP